MSFHSAYSAIVSRIYDDYITLKPKTQNPDIPSSDWFSLTNDTFKLDVNMFLRVMYDLEQIGAIKICNVMDMFDGTKENGVSHDENGYPNTTEKYQDVSYVVCNKEVLKNKLIDLNESGAEDEESLKVIESNELKGEAVGPFVVHVDDTVVYDGQLMKLPPQEMNMLAVLLRNEGKLTNYSDITDVVLGADSKPVDQDRMRRIVSELNKKLFNLLGVKPISSKPTQGWTMTLSVR